MPTTQAEKTRKGASVSGEGAKVRAAIRRARKRGSTTEDIARAARRDDSTIALIENGTIMNTPAGMAARIDRAATSSDKPTQRTRSSKAKAERSRAEHS